MLKNVSLDQLTHKIHNDNPNWTIDAAKAQASEYILLWDERLSNILNDYLTKGIETDYKYGEFSILLIKALRHNCSYLYAIYLMDAYIKDPLNGKALILRR